MCFPLSLVHLNSMAVGRNACTLDGIFFVQLCVFSRCCQYPFIVQVYHSLIDILDLSSHFNIIVTCKNSAQYLVKFYLLLLPGKCFGGCIYCACVHMHTQSSSCL